MKSMLFGLALLCALPGCCGMWKCDEKDSCGKKDKKEMKKDSKKHSKKMDKKDAKK